MLGVVLGVVVGAAGIFGVTHAFDTGGGLAPEQQPQPLVVTATPLRVMPTPNLARATPQPVRTSTPFRFPTPVPGRCYIPYSGNGGGPTLCNDGSISNSSGRGTCSHHGGVAR